MDEIEGWWVIAESREVQRAPRSVTRMGERIVLWRDDRGVLHAHDARCPHRGVDLGEGRVVRGELECAYHGLRFDASGRCVAMPCEGAEARVPPRMQIARRIVREARGLVWMWRGSVRDAPLPWPDVMPAHDRRAWTRTMIWDVPLSRVMEAMLDVHHFPFAHRRFSSGVGPRLDPWRVREEDGVVRAEGTMREEKARRGWNVALEARLPAIVFLSFTPWLGGFVACTPIDATHTWIVVRFFVDVPVIGALLARFALWTELTFVQPDDERMQLRTLRERNDLSECTLVRADAAIVAWDRLARKPWVSER
ncbi:Rieske 2Fe-2S domain-containing protein [Sandaracinus amylolyticus]|uniref:Rieske 2Fe-2S domain-containing protein n=1 Tax=Sandaracinus amylolyticus TaxID=927083 RepID=UPI001F312C71|nr:Rieske 2Fe-2S domain-containing protein [Sandaracinus amylolyticus]UJR85346.1 Hypothetical protein I5071_74260 [Sandaracinus amylolyticus]